MSCPESIVLVMAVLPYGAGGLPGCVQRCSSDRYVQAQGTRLVRGVGSTGNVWHLTPAGTLLGAPSLSSVVFVGGVLLWSTECVCSVCTLVFG